MRARSRLSSYWTRAGRAWRRLRTRAIRVMVKNSEPRMVALGAAIGVFVSVLPCIGFQMVLAILIATALGANKLAATAFVWVSNPLFFYMDYVIGKGLLDLLHVPTRHPKVLNWYDFVGPLLQNLFLPVLVGSVAFGLICGAVTYAVGLRVAMYYRQRAALRKAARGSGTGDASGEGV
jgi:uncharacterized protein (DUF2062 family)